MASSTTSDFDLLLADVRRTGRRVLKQLSARLRLRWTIHLRPTLDAPALELRADSLGFRLARLAPPSLAPPSTLGASTVADWHLEFSASELEVLDGVEGPSVAHEGARGRWRRLFCEDRYASRARSHEAFVLVAVSQLDGELRTVVNVQPIRMVVSYACVEFLQDFLEKLSRPE